MYIVVYNTASQQRSKNIELELVRHFGFGAKLKEGVFLIPEQNGEDIMDSIVTVIDDKISNGDSVYISKLGNNRAYRGYPKRFRDWLNNKT